MVTILKIRIDFNDGRNYVGKGKEIFFYIYYLIFFFLKFLNVHLKIICTVYFFISTLVITSLCCMISQRSLPLHSPTLEMCKEYIVYLQQVE